MPYRRLPNTDKARILAMQTALPLCQTTSMGKRTLTDKTLNEAKVFLPQFERAHTSYLESLAKQVAASKKYQQQLKTVRLYISHFIQVLNFGVIRNEIKKESKRLYELEPSDFSVPDLGSEKALLTWGERIIKGEQERIKNGGAPIYNPAIAKVSVHYDLFKDSSVTQKTFQKSTNRTLAQLADLREKADTLILDIWNQIEEQFDSYPEEQKREICQTYGLRYYYRRNEKK